MFYDAYCLFVFLCGYCWFFFNVFCCYGALIVLFLYAVWSMLYVLCCVAFYDLYVFSLCIRFIVVIVSQELATGYVCK